MNQAITTYYINSFILISIFCYSIINTYAYLDLENYLFYLFFQTIIYFLFWLVIKNLFQQDYQNRLFGLVIGWYIIFGYYLKPVVMLSNYQDINSLKNFTFEQYIHAYITTLPNIVFQSIIIFTLLIVVSKLTNKQNFRAIDKRILNLNTIFLIVFFSLILKFIVHYTLGMGIPGMTPKTNIPVFGGLITYYVRFSLFAVLNFYLLYSIIKGKRIHLITSFLSIITFVLIDMSIASKYSMFYQVFIFVIIYNITKKNYKLPTAYIFVLILFSIVLFLTYKYMNYFRFAMLSGHDIMTSITIALQTKGLEDKSFLISIFSRISGIEKIFFLEQFKEASQYIHVHSFFDSSFSKDFTRLVTGIDNDNNAVGATQMGVLYILSSKSWEYYTLLPFLYILVYSVFTLFFFFIKKNIFFREEYYLVSSITGIFGIYFLFGSGNSLFFLKEFIVFFISIAFIMKLSRIHYV